MAHAIDIAGQPGGADILVDHRNVHRYIDRVLDLMLAEGVRIPMTAFREGFSRVFPIWDLQTFSTDEMLAILGNPDEDWTFESEFGYTLCFGTEWV